MKKTTKALALCLALCLCLAFCGCKKEEEDTASNTSSNALTTDYFDGVSTVAIDASTIFQQARSGSFTAKTADGDNVAVSLGQTKEELDNAFAAVSYPLSEMDGETYVNYSCGSTVFYFWKNAPEKGVVNIVHFDMAFGFEIGITDQESVIAVLGEPQEKGVATDAQRAVVPDPISEVTRLAYDCEGNRLEFFFINNLLSATSLNVITEWQPK